MVIGRERPMLLHAQIYSVMVSSVLAFALALIASMLGAALTLAALVLTVATALYLVSAESIASRYAALAYSS